MPVRQSLFSTRTISAAALGAILFTSAAASAEATAEGARALTDSIAVYVGQPAIDKGYVSVVPDGDAYRIAIDLARAVGDLAGDRVALTVYEDAWIRTMPVDGGLWRITDLVYPSLKVEFRSKDGSSVSPDFYEWRPEGQRVDALFDPGLGGFRTFDMHIDRTVSMQRFNGRESRSESLNSVISGRDSRNADRGLDSHAQVVAGSQVFSTDFGGGRRLELKAAPAGFSFDLLGLVPWPIELLRRDAATSGSPSTDKQETALLKRLAPELLPVFQRLSMATSAEKMTLDLPRGRLTADRIRLAFEIPGATRPARLALSLDGDGLALDGQMMPAWAAPLAPTGIDATLALVDFDLDTPARLLIDRLDPEADEPLLDADFEAAGRTVFPDGEMKFVLEPSTVTGSGYAAAVEGRLSVVHDGLKPGRGGKRNPASPPLVEGTATISLTNLDGVLASLQDAGAPPEVQNLIPALIFARGLARMQDDGRAVWQVAMAQNGSVTVNGQMLVPPSR